MTKEVIVEELLNIQNSILIEINNYVYHDDGNKKLMMNYSAINSLCKIGKEVSVLLEAMVNDR